MAAALVLVASYLLGSIPCSYLVARKWGIADVRKVGSGNVGATNVMRSAGKLPGLVAFGLDFAKGTAASLLALRVASEGSLAALAAATAVIGHMHSVWIGLKGGKGVATGAGAFLPLAPAATAIALGVFAVTLAVTRYVSLGSVLGTLSLALAAFLLGTPPSVVLSAALVGMLIVWKHRGNLERIRGGAENRLGRKPA
jgi:glycerol-3-phosphate acyltransferase PlsY